MTSSVSATFRHGTAATTSVPAAAPATPGTRLTASTFDVVSADSTWLSG